ncbi:MAG: hypothetical protein ACTSVV_03175 [Promethearchaeota archaeon]
MIDRKLHKTLEKIWGKHYLEDYCSKNFFEIRIVIQKTLYLLMHNDNHKIEFLQPYKWTFYLRGPYSSDIAHMLFHINNLKSEIDKKEIKFNEEELKSIDLFIQFKNKLEEINDLNKKNQNKDYFINISDIFEAAATLLYIYRDLNSNLNEKDKINLNFNKISRVFKELKLELSERLRNEQLSKIFNLLKEFNYIKSGN